MVSWTQAGVVNQDITLEIGKLYAAYTILLFYQGEYLLCGDALIRLANKYRWLEDQSVCVIAISSDTIDQEFEKKLAYHQWPDNYCDFTGMNGKHFNNYGVLGVQTLFLLDHHGKVLKKAAIVDELLEIIDKKKPFDLS